MKRRSFLKYSSAVAVPVVLGNMPVYALAGSSVNGYEDRVLVLIQCNGGNDGLSSLVPLDHYDALANVRPNIIIPENKLLPITDTLAFHPSLDGLRSIFDQGKLKILQGVGYPDQNRSHFRSSDIWHSASESDEIKTTGWIGDYLDSTYSGYPEAYPNDDFPDPFAITMGNTVSETCQGPSSNFSMVVSDPERINQLTGQFENPTATGCAADQLAYINQTIIQSNVYGGRMAEAYDNGTNISSQYLDDSLSNQLKTIARLIAGGLKTRVYIATLGGFDTHADQVQGGDPTLGEHAQLMASLGGAIQAFQDDLELLGIHEQVAGMTYSEFGRRIRSNDSLGTDHGDAAPLFVFGHCIEGGVLGTNAEILPDVSTTEGVPMQHDFRSVYGSMFMDWFGLSEDEMSALLPHDFQKLDLAGNCAVINTSNSTPVNSMWLEAYPNPTTDKVLLSASTTISDASVMVLNEVGKVVFVRRNIQLSRDSGLVINLEEKPTGAYFIRVQSSDHQQVLRVVKI